MRSQLQPVKNLEPGNPDRFRLPFLLPTAAAGTHEQLQDSPLFISQENERLPLGEHPAAEKGFQLFLTQELPVAADFGAKFEPVDGGVTRCGDRLDGEFPLPLLQERVTKPEIKSCLPEQCGKLPQSREEFVPGNHQFGGELKLSAERV